MAKKEWDPTQPLEDDEDEAEVQRRARATARHKHLEGKYLSALKNGDGEGDDKDDKDDKDRKPPKRKKLW